MIKKQNGVAFIIELGRRFFVIFSLAVIAISTAGMVIWHYEQPTSDLSSLFALEGGLRYSSILQLAGFSLIMAFFSVILFSEHLQTKIQFFLRGLLLLLAALVTASIFAVIFNWFLTDDIWGWFTFVFLTIVSFAVSFSLTLLKLKLEGKKYTRLLADYRVRHGNPS
ncbi:MAG: hypothetical protein LBI03_03345 [Clostridiales bacterium]|jgi:hypothetical protein|nr:hypothetical protein [Clostridiales bacterium]